ncbi:hypothetical protein Hanom_Chr16g01507391 [Helianthus anomalus]
MLISSQPPHPPPLLRNPTRTSDSHIVPPPPTSPTSQNLSTTTTTTCLHHRFLALLELTGFFIGSFLCSIKEDFDEFGDVDMVYNTLSLDMVDALEDLVFIVPPGLVKV